MDASFLNLLLRVRITLGSPLWKAKSSGDDRDLLNRWRLNAVGIVLSAFRHAGMVHWLIAGLPSRAKGVRSSLPAPIFPVSSKEGQLPFKQWNGGSNPPTGTTRFVRRRRHPHKVSRRDRHAHSRPCWICSTAKSTATVNRGERIRLPHPVPFIGLAQW